MYRRQWHKRTPNQLRHPESSYKVVHTCAGKPSARGEKIELPFDLLKKGEAMQIRRYGEHTVPKMGSVRSYATNAEHAGTGVEFAVFHVVDSHDIIVKRVA